MGAINKRYEKRIEKGLRDNKPRGIPAVTQGDRAASDGVVPSWSQSEDPRAAVPPLGLREYWYPALPASKVKRKPVYWNMLGDDLVFFRNKQDEVAALSDVCPHRGASMSEGACYYRGFLSCPYHGATFNGQGECVAFIPEGPDSKMVGNLTIRSYPTRTLKGWVFIWMGDGAPAPIEEDVPPELFEEGNVLISSTSYWMINWLIAIENHSDSHNANYLHRNSIKQILGLSKGRTRTPLGAQGKIVNGRGLISTHADAKYYARDGKVPYQMYYPGVNGVWPLRRWRLLWYWFFDLFKTLEKRAPFDKYDEWGRGHHLPGVVRSGGGSTRYAIAVGANLSRIVYFYFPRAGNAFTRALKTLYYHLIYFPLEYNFSNQDGFGTSSCRYWTPEHLAPTDSQIVILRKMVIEMSRDAERRRAGLGAGGGPEEKPHQGRAVRHGKGGTPAHRETV